MIGEIISGLSGLAGLLQANSAQQHWQNVLQQSIQGVNGANMSMYGNMLGTDQQNLAQATGYGANALKQLGSRLGDTMANAGVYNSSAVAGALSQATQNEQSQLTGLAQRNYSNEQNLLANNNLEQAQLQGNMARTMLGQANTQYGQAVGGLGSFLGSWAQNNLGRSGYNQNLGALPQINGNQNKGWAATPNYGNVLSPQTPGYVAGVNNQLLGPAGSAAGIGGYF